MEYDKWYQGSNRTPGVVTGTAWKHHETNQYGEELAIGNKSSYGGGLDIWRAPGWTVEVSL